jgi:alpha-tubulin suppressor-like RCC1 family protein
LAGRNITIENDSTAPNVIIARLMIEGEDTVELIDVKIAKLVSIATSYSHSLALDNEGSLWTTGYNIYGQLGLGNNNNYPNVFISVSSF